MTVRTKRLLFVVGAFVPLLITLAFAYFAQEETTQDKMADLVAWPHKPPRLVVFGVDALGIELVKTVQKEMPALLPNITRALKDGAQLSAIEPNSNWSAPNWVSFFSGQAPDSHGLHSFGKQESSSWRLYLKEDRKASLLWETLAEAGISTGVIGFYGNHPVNATGGGILNSGYEVSLRALLYDEYVAAATKNQTAFDKATASFSLKGSFIKRSELGSATPHLERIWQKPCGLGELKTWLKDTGFDMMMAALQDSYHADKSQSTKNYGSVTKNLCRQIRLDAWQNYLIQQDKLPQFTAFYWLGLDFALHRVYDLRPKFYKKDRRFLKDLAAGKTPKSRHGRIIKEALVYIDKLYGKFLELRASNPKLSVVLLSDHGLHPSTVKEEKFDLSWGQGLLLVSGPLAKEEIAKKLNPADVYRILRQVNYK